MPAGTKKTFPEDARIEVTVMCEKCTYWWGAVINGPRGLWTPEIIAKAVVRELEQARAEGKCKCEEEIS